LQTEILAYTGQQLIPDPEKKIQPVVANLE
jgi:hypothetical protein